MECNGAFVAASLNVPLPYPAPRMGQNPDRAFKRHERVCRVRTPDGHCASPVGIRPCQVRQPLGEDLHGTPAHPAPEPPDSHVQPQRLPAAWAVGKRARIVRVHMARAPVTARATPKAAAHGCLHLDRASARPNPLDVEPGTPGNNSCVSIVRPPLSASDSPLVVTFSLRRCTIACSAARNPFFSPSAYRDFASHFCGACPHGCVTSM